MISMIDVDDLIVEEETDEEAEVKSFLIIQNIL